MTYFDIPLRIDFPALHPLEKAYLNNRIRCVRHTMSPGALRSCTRSSR